MSHFMYPLKGDVSILSLLVRWSVEAGNLNQSDYWTVLIFSRPRFNSKQAELTEMKPNFVKEIMGLCSFSNQAKVFQTTSVTRAGVALHFYFI